MSRYRTNDGEWESQRPTHDIGTDALPLFALATGVDAPPPNADTSGDARRERVLAALEDRRKDWIDRIHAGLVAQLARAGYDGVVSANEARREYLTFPDCDPAVDFRFLAALWRRRGWVQVDMDGRSTAPDNHARRIARYRYDPSAAERAARTEAA